MGIPPAIEPQIVMPTSICFNCHLTERFCSELATSIAIATGSSVVGGTETKGERKQGIVKHGFMMIHEFHDSCPLIVCSEMTLRVPKQSTLAMGPLLTEMPQIPTLISSITSIYKIDIRI